MAGHVLSPINLPTRHLSLSGLSDSPTPCQRSPIFYFSISIRHQTSRSPLELLTDMESRTSLRDGYLNGSHRHHPLSSSSSSSFSPRDVNYSCGFCGYELNLSSSNRNTSTIGSKYGKSIKRGIISFFFIDESRFTQVDELKCLPYFISKHSWGFFRGRTKLLCRKCGKHVGNAYSDHTSSYPLSLDGSDSASGNETSHRRKYDICIRALQPSSSKESGVRLFT